MQLENEKTGYVYKKDLDAAQGSGNDAPPEQVLKRKASSGSHDRRIAVYDAEGITIIGEFVIAGTASKG